MASRFLHLKTCIKINFTEGKPAEALQYSENIMIQGWRKRSGCSGFGWTSFSQGKNEIQFLEKASNKQKC